MASPVVVEKGSSDEGSSGGGTEFGWMKRNNNGSSTSVWEIEEEVSSSGGGAPLVSIKEENLNTDDEGSLFSYDIRKGSDTTRTVVYVVISGKSSEETSMDALVWTLKHALELELEREPEPEPISSSSEIDVYLIHVFPELRYIPTPLGKLPINQSNPGQKEKYLTQERAKRRDFLQKFLDICSASKVKVETILIESDMEAKAILDLIPILNITKLVLGTSKSSLRKLKSRRGNETADQILQNVPEFCELNIICEGKQVQFDDPISEPPSPQHHSTEKSPKPSMQDQVQIHESFTCSCFKPKAVA